MDTQDTNYQPGADLPRPYPETANQPSAGEASINVPKPEIVPGVEEKPLSGQPLPAIPVPDNSQATPTMPPPIVQNSPTTIPVTTTTPAVAEDSDLIEQEWVSKAKAIVESTRNDPHTQNKEINKIKADYIKKRYNKEIKVTTD